MGLDVSIDCQWFLFCPLHHLGYLCESAIGYKSSFIIQANNTLSDMT